MAATIPGRETSRAILIGARDRSEHRQAAGAVAPPSDLRTINYSGVIGRELCAARNRVINPQHYDCSDNGHDDAADINTSYAFAT